MDLGIRPYMNVAVADFLMDVEGDAQFRQRQFLRPLDPFELPDRQFIQIYRLNKDMVENIINGIEEFHPQRRISAIDVPTKVLTALRFFAAGSYQLDVGNSIFSSISQSSVSRCIKEVVEYFNRRDVFREWVHFPRNIAELNHVRKGFYEKYGFPGIVGCVDGTHVAIYPPNIGHALYPENDYFNRKNYHSINTQLICDSNMKILHVNARYPGSTHDSFVWDNSNVLPLLRQLHEQQQTYFVIGDSGYKLRPWFLTPVDNAEPNTPESRYNMRFKTTRSIIEQCNGVLKMRFRCLLKHRVLHYSPTVASKIINTCTVLHNMCIHHNIPAIVDGDDDNNEDEDLGIYPPNNDEMRLIAEDARRLRVDPELARGRAFRRRLIQRHFTY